MSDKQRLDHASELRVLFDRMAAGLCTAIPGIIVAFDSATCLCSVRPGVMMKTVLPTLDGKSEVKYMALPVVEHVPICLPHSPSAGLFLTVPIKAGDPCLIVFSQRSIDRIVSEGYVSGNPQYPVDAPDPSFSDIRHHDLTDAICIPNLTLAPNAIQGWAQDAVEIRNAAGTVKVSVKADEVNVVAPTVNVQAASAEIQATAAEIDATTLTVVAPTIEITGAATLTGTLIVTGEVTANGIPLSTHIHGGVTGGLGNTEGPSIP